MKNTLLLFSAIALVFVISTTAYGESPFIGTRIDLRCERIKGTVLTPNIPRTPLQTPEVYLDDHTLLFSQEFEDDLFVTVEDEDEVNVYSSYLYAGQIHLTLPGSLSGDHTLKIYKGYFVFIGEISLD